MSPAFTALDSIRDSGVTIASDGAEYKSKFLFFEDKKGSTKLFLLQKLANLIL